jgi:hypothetical protein
VNPLAIKNAIFSAISGGLLCWQVLARSGAGHVSFAAGCFLLCLFLFIGSLRND